MSPLERVARSMRHPVRFVDNGVERCLTLDEAATMLRRLEAAIQQAHAEINGRAACACCGAPRAGVHVRHDERLCEDCALAHDAGDFACGCYPCTCKPWPGDVHGIACPVLDAVGRTPGRSEG